jgi:ubiquinone/menaquinone biosynthesis C-methylase UbiE
METYDKELKTKLSNIKNVLNVNDVLARDGNIESIRKYYKLNKLAYSVFHNKKGFVHLGLSDSDSFKDEDLLVQLKIIGKYIEENNAKEVLELAMGKGANSKYLAEKYPDVNFYGLDLENGQLNINDFKNIPNLQASYGDYHKLDSFTDGKFDVVYVLEALCYSDNKDVVAKEVYRVLKNGGLFIVIDGYSGKRVDELNEDELLAKQLNEKGMMLSSFEYIDDAVDKIKSAGFSLIENKDYSQNVVPTFERLEKVARKTSRAAFKLKIIGNVLNKILPNEVTFNAISAYLTPVLIRKGVFCYKLLVFKK